MWLEENSARENVPAEATAAREAAMAEKRMFFFRGRGGWVCVCVKKEEG